jgi:hypothetical protein
MEKKYSQGLAHCRLPWNFQLTWWPKCSCRYWNMRFMTITSTPGHQFFRPSLFEK